MRVCRNMSPLVRDEFENTQRRFGRVKCKEISCSLGQVLDLSAGGMRIRSRGTMGLRVGESVGVTLRAESGFLIPVPSRVVWMTKSGWRNCELGLTFMELSNSARESLSGIARGVPFQGDTLRA